MKEKRFTQVAFLDVCYPDYFSGYHMPVIAVVADGSTTIEELVEGIRQDVKCFWDYLIGENGFTEEEMTLFDEYCKELLRDNEKTDKVFPDLPVLKEDEDYQNVAYFSLCKPVTKYGLTFLNE